MTTSGTITFNQNQLQIIQDAFYHLNVYSTADVISELDVQFAANQFNKMIKAWNAQGNHLWKKSEATLFLQPNQVVYTINSETSDNITNSYVSTTISTAAIIGQTTLAVASSAGMSPNDYIGIQLDNGYLQWTTVSSIPNSTSVVISAALADTAAVGNIIYDYTNKINRPLRVVSGRRNSNINIDTPLYIYSYAEYFDLPNKTTSPSTPTGFLYNPQLNAGLFYVWPVPTLVTDKINFTYEDCLQDITNVTDTPDFPQEWLEVLTLQLAVRLSYRYGKRNGIDKLKNDADMMLENIKGWDNEDGSLYFQRSSYWR
jgi:hypothetical protein